MTEGEKMAKAVDAEGLRILREGDQRRDRLADWGRENGVRMPFSVLYETPPFRKHFRRSGNRWLEKVMLVNRDGFRKEVEVDADQLACQMPAVEKIDFSKTIEPGATMKVLTFSRTQQRLPDGMAIFEEVW